LTRDATWSKIRHVATINYPESREALQGARGRSGLSYKRLADAVGISERHAIKLCNGEHRPMPELRDKLAAALKVSPSSLPAAGTDRPFVPTESSAGS